MAKYALPMTRKPVAVSLEYSRQLWAGAPKVGKTVQANRTRSGTLFLATERGQDHVESYVAEAHTWADVNDIVDALEEARGSGRLPYRSVAVDTVKGLYDLCRTHLLAKRGGKEGPLEHEDEMGAFGKGSEIVISEFRRVITKLCGLQMGIIMLAHVEEKTITIRPKNSQPFEQTKVLIDLPPKVRKVLMPMVDLMLYFTKEERNGKEHRVIKTKPSQFYEAGVRYPPGWTKQLPATLPMDWYALEKAWLECAPSVEEAARAEANAVAEDERRHRAELERQEAERRMAQQRQQQERRGAQQQRGPQNGPPQGYESEDPRPRQDPRQAQNGNGNGNGYNQQRPANGNGNGQTNGNGHSNGNGQARPAQQQQRRDQGPPPPDPRQQARPAEQQRAPQQQPPAQHAPRAEPAPAQQQPAPQAQQEPPRSAPEPSRDQPRQDPAPAPQQEPERPQTEAHGQQQAQRRPPPGPIQPPARVAEQRAQAQAQPNGNGNGQRTPARVERRTQIRAHILTPDGSACGELTGDPSGWPPTEQSLPMEFARKSNCAVCLHKVFPDEYGHPEAAAS